MSTKLEQVTKNVASDDTEALKRAQELSKQTKKEKQASKRNTTTYAVVEVDKQSSTEHRHYMRNFHIDEAENIVRHKTSHSKSEIVDKIACAVYDALVSTQKVSFVTADFIEQFKTFGSSYGDVIRNAVDALASKKYILKRSQRTNARTRKTYLYVTNILHADFQAIITTLDAKKQATIKQNYEKALKDSTKY